MIPIVSDKVTIGFFFINHKMPLTSLTNINIVGTLVALFARCSFRNCIISQSELEFLSAIRFHHSYSKCHQYNRNVGHQQFYSHYLR